MKKTHHKRPPPVIAPASSPCLLHELCADGSLRADPEQARDVARWRTAQRERLLKARGARSAAERARAAEGILRLLDERVAGVRAGGPSVSVYWPIRAEPDLRSWMEKLCRSGVRVALPVAMALARPLIFRAWCPGSRLARGLWNIPYPAEGEALVPDIVIAPLVGFDRQGYRLGYGGGFFDRTLATLSPKPLTLGVGYSDAELSTIYPQPHDVPMDWVITPSSAFAATAAKISP
jgi:5-formyltetrahydrofolate cyclo-ligase